MTPSLKTLSALLILHLSGCTTNQMIADRTLETMSPWKGKHISELLADWGAPSQVVDCMNGKKMYVYKTSYTQTYPGTSTTYGNITSYGAINAQTYGSGGFTVTRGTEKTFWVNEQGIIVRGKASVL